MSCIKDTNLQHIAVILDGNGRWAKERGLSRSEGHKAGVENLRILMSQCRELNIKYLTLYVFSTENWNRPILEVSNLMNLFNKYIKNELNELMEEGVRLNAIGELDNLPKITKKLLFEAMKKTEKNNKLVLTLALNYGSRLEIVNCVKRISENIINDNLQIDDINEKTISNYLYTKDIPDPDFLIRTSGEYRLSNFLLWQCAYTEFWYTDVLWPDFKKEHLLDAIENFTKRKRRFGKVSDE